MGIFSSLCSVGVCWSESVCRCLESVSRHSDWVGDKICHECLSQQETPAQ